MPRKNTRGRSLTHFDFSNFLREQSKDCFSSLGVKLDDIKIIGGSTLRFKLDSRPEIPSTLLDKVDFIGPYLETGIWSETLRRKQSIKNVSRPLMGLGSPSSQKKGYNVPDGMVGGNGKGNSQMVWGPGSK